MKFMDDQKSEPEELEMNSDEKSLSLLNGVMDCYKHSMLFQMKLQTDRIINAQANSLYSLETALNAQQKEIADLKKEMGKGFLLTAVALLALLAITFVKR
jgi:hypothetical protein